VPVLFKDVGSEFFIQVRKKAIPATVVKLPFYKK
jgi:aminomethyltransferase